MPFPLPLRNPTQPKLPKIKEHLYLIQGSNVSIQYLLGCQQEIAQQDGMFLPIPASHLKELLRELSVRNTNLKSKLQHTSEVFHTSDLPIKVAESSKKGMRDTNLTILD